MSYGNYSHNVPYFLPMSLKNTKLLIFFFENKSCNENVRHTLSLSHNHFSMLDTIKLVSIIMSNFVIIFSNNVFSIWDILLLIKWM